MLIWIVLFALHSAFALWVLRGGGAQWLEGSRALFFIDWVRANQWSAEQIRLYALLLWLAHAAWFVAGLLVPGWRPL